LGHNITLKGQPGAWQSHNITVFDIIYLQGPQATRLSAADVNQGEQSDNAAREDEVSSDQTSSLAQVTERQSTNGNVSALTKSFTQLEHRDRTGQNGIYPHQLFDGTTCSVRTGLDSPGASDVQQQSTNQMMARSMVEQCTPGVRLQSDAATIELNGVVTPCGDHTSSFSSVDVNQGEPSDNAGSEDVSSDQTSSLAEVTEQRSTNGNVSTLTKSLTQLQHRDRTGQNGIYPHQRFDGNTCSVRTGLDNPGASNVQQQSTNQMMTRSMVEQCTPGVRLQSDATTIELNEVVTPCGDHTSSFLSVDVNQGEQSDNAGREDVSSDQTSTLAQVTEQRSTNANVSTLTKSLTQLQRHNQTGQNGIYPHQRFNDNTCSVRTGLDNPEASNVQQRSTNQMMTRFMVDQCTPGVRLRSDATTIELNEVVMPCGDHTSSFSCADRTSSFSCADRTSSFSQATEQKTMNASSSSLTQHPYRDEAFQTVTNQYEPSSGNTTLVRTWLDSPGELNVPWQSANQTTTNSTSEHMLEGGLQSDPFTPELSRLLTLRDLVTKRHLLEVAFSNPSLIFLFIIVCLK
jgi:DNA-binding IscR family transcriptional regulator